MRAEVVLTHDNRPELRLIPESCDEDLKLRLVAIAIDIGRADIKFEEYRPRDAR